MSPNQQRQITKGKNFTVQVINVLLRSSSLLDVMHRCWNFKRESTSAILSMSSLKSIDDETTDILKVSAVLDTSKFDSIVMTIREEQAKHHHRSVWHLGNESI